MDIALIIHTKEALFLPRILQIFCKTYLVLLHGFLQIPLGKPAFLSQQNIQKDRPSREPSNVALKMNISRSKSTHSNICVVVALVQFPQNRSEV